MAKTSSPDAWFAAQSDFAKPLCETLRDIVHRAAPDLEEVMRWSVVCFKGNGLVCAIGAFKAHVSLVLFRGTELDDPRGLFSKDSGSGAMKAIKFKSAAEIKPAPLRDIIQRAVKLDTSDTPKVKVARAETPVPPALKKALAKNKTAKKNFDAMPPSHRREYNEWIAGAKQEESVQRRVEKAIAKLSAGEGLNDKYRSKG